MAKPAVDVRCMVVSKRTIAVRKKPFSRSFDKSTQRSCMHGFVYLKGGSVLEILFAGQWLVRKNRKMYVYACIS